MARKSRRRKSSYAARKTKRRSRSRSRKHRRCSRRGRAYRASCIRPPAPPFYTSPNVPPAFIGYNPSKFASFNNLPGPMRTWDMDCSPPCYPSRPRVPFYPSPPTSSSPYSSVGPCRRSRTSSNRVSPYDLRNRSVPPRTIPY